MDPLSIGSSALSLRQIEDNEQKNDDAFLEVIASCRSLSNYDEPLTLRTALPQAIASLIAASFHIVIGLSLAFSAILIPQIESSTDDFKLSKKESSWIASIIVIAIPIGCIFSGFLMEWIGRLNTVKLAAIPCTIGWTSIALAQNFYVLLFGRIITGLGCAIGTSPAIVYITEVARPDLRGSLISCAPTIASLGMIIAYVKGAFMDWRLVSWLSIIYTIIPIVFVQIFVPESPVWLVSKGRMEDAAKSLAYLYKNYPAPKYTTQSLVDMHLTSLQRERENKIMQKMKSSSKMDAANESSKKSLCWNWKNCKLAGFLKPTGYKPLFILFWLFLIQQYSGIYITLFYSVTFFQEVGSSIDAYTASIFVGITRFLMSLSNAWLLKRFKRRRLVMVSSLGMAGCMFISGAFTLWLKNGETDLYWVPVVCFMLYVCSSMIGLLSIPWTMTAELFPNEIRGIGHSVAYSMANILMFIAIQSYRSISDAIGGAYAVQWLFSVISVCGFFFALLFLPETHGKKLSEIEEYFSGAKKTKVKTKFVNTNNNNAKNGGAKKNGTYNNRKPKNILETVTEAEKMINENNKEMV